jgi:hypothetical protein
MKAINLIKGCSAMITSALLVVSCAKKTDKIAAPETTNFADKVFVQVYNGIVGSARNYVYVDGNPVTGAALAFNSVFPSTPANFVAGDGFRAFLVKDTLSTSTQVPISFAENLQAGKYYTIFLYDSLNLPKKKIVSNDISMPGDTTSRVRFANFIYTTTAVGNVDLFSVKRNATVFTNVNLTDVTGYVPYASALNDTLLVKDNLSGTVLATLNGFNPVQKRSYTLVFRGRYQTTGTTGIARLLTAFASN